MSGEFVEIFAFFGIELSINQEGCEILAVIILIGNVITYGMIAHFFKGFECLIRFAQSYLIGRDKPVILGKPVMMVKQIVAVNHKIQLIRNTEHFNFTLPRGRIVRKIIV